MPSKQIYGDQSSIFEGQPYVGVNILSDAISQRYWFNGESYPVLYTQNFELNGKSVNPVNISSTLSLGRGFTGTSNSTNELKLVYSHGGSAGQQKALKYWLEGASFQLLQAGGGNPAKSISASIERKPQKTNYPASVKTIDARIPIKKSSSGGSGGGSSLHIGEQTVWYEGLPIQPMLKESNS